MSLDERRMVRQMLAGDERAFASFFDGHFARLFRFVLPRVDGNEDEAEEIVQTVLTQAIDKLETFRGEASLFTWLCTFCRREIARARRRRDFGTGVALVEDRPEVRAALESAALVDDAIPDVQFDRQELSRLVQVALDTLPPHYGNALEWKYLQELSVDRIAERLAISPKAAESLLSRARKAFRDSFLVLLRGSTSQRYPSET